jgi:hypothetical protein
MGILEVELFMLGNVWIWRRELFWILMVVLLPCCVKENVCTIMFPFQVLRRVF